MVEPLRVGLAGLGTLGEAMVGPARAFGMEVIAWSQNLTQERADEVGVARVSQADLLAASDFLSIHLVLGERHDVGGLDHVVGHEYPSIRCGGG